MNKLIGLVLCGIIGVTGVIGVPIDGQQKLGVVVDELGSPVLLSAKQKETLRKVTNKYAVIAGKENGLKQEVLEQFKKEVANICVADDETDGELQDAKQSDKIMWYVIGGAALLVGGLIVYKLFFSKSKKDKIIASMREASEKIKQVREGNMPMDSYIAWVLKQPQYSGVEIMSIMQQATAEERALVKKTSLDAASLVLPPSKLALVEAMLDRLINP